MIKAVTGKNCFDHVASRDMTIYNRMEYFKFLVRVRVKFEMKVSVRHVTAGESISKNWVQNSKNPTHVIISEIIRANPARQKYQNGL